MNFVDLMNNGIFVEYKGGVSKIIDTNEDWFEYEPNLSLNSLLLKIHKRYEHKLNNIDSIQGKSVLLMLNNLPLLLKGSKTVLASVN